MLNLKVYQPIKVKQTIDQVRSMEYEYTSSNSTVTQFVGDNIDLNIVSIYGKTPFHSIGMIKVTNPAYKRTSAAANIFNLKAIDKAKILKATEVKIHPLTNRKQTDIYTIIFLSSLSYPSL